MGKYNKVIFGGLAFAALAAQSVVAAHGFNTTSISAIVTAFIGIFLVHQAPNVPPHVS